MENNVNILESKINHIILSIENKVQEKVNLFQSLGVKHGILGLSFFYFTLSDYFNNEEYRIKGSDLLQQCIDKLNENYVSSTIFREIAELGQFIEFGLSKNWIQKNDIGNILNDIDSILISVLYDEIKSKNFDPVTGALAYGQYFLKRTNSKNHQIIKELVDFLITISCKDSNGNIYWESVFKEPKMIYLGITHGVTNIILFLINVQNMISYRRGDIEELIEGACKYIRSNELKNEPLVFPLIIGDNVNYDRIPKNYCYGDYGTLFGLYKGYQWLNDNEALGYCYQTFLTVHNKGYKSPYLNAGNSLLYGDAGIAMLFRNFYYLSEQNLFKEVYENKIMNIINSFKEDNYLLGYKGYWNQETKITNFCLSEGMIGIALELICYQRKDYKLHDEFFFL